MTPPPFWNFSEKTSVLVFSSVPKVKPIEEENIRFTLAGEVLFIFIFTIPFLLAKWGNFWSHWPLLFAVFREGCTKQNPEKVWSFAKTKFGKSLVFCQTGGVLEGSKMPNLYFGKVFFQLACRIILGPPKHVLHLVWSCLNIYLGGFCRLNWPFYVGYSGQLWPKITKEIYLFLKWDQA